MFDDNEIIEGEFENSQSTALVASGAGAVTQQVRTGYTTALSVQKPRDLEQVRRDFLVEARLMGEAAYYGWGAGKDRIEGASQALAYAAARRWGNCAVDSLPIEETPEAWVFTSVFIDCETGFTLTRKYRQSKKSKVYGKHDEERKDAMRFGSGQSKSDRNVICKALPKWLIDQGLDEAKAGVRKKLQGYIDKHGLPAAIDYSMKELAKSGVTPERVCNRFSVAKPSALTLENLVIIAGDIKAIQQGQEYPEALYPADDAADMTRELLGGNKTPKPQQQQHSQPSSEVLDWIEGLKEMTPDMLKSKAPKPPAKWSAEDKRLAQEAIDRIIGGSGGGSGTLFDSQVSATEGGM